MPTAGPLTAASTGLGMVRIVGDDRVVALGQDPAHVGMALGRALLAAGQVAQVGAGREGAPGARDDHGAHAVVLRRPP